MTASSCSDARRAAYGTLLRQSPGETPRSLAAVVDAAWPVLHPTGVSWLGFYRHRPVENDLVLECCRDRPACSPIGLHGVCGQAHRSGRTRIVHDVEVLGSDYVACDPADRSEIVIPCRGRGPGGTWIDYVLDLDSRRLAAFSDEDDRSLRRFLVGWGLDPRHEGDALVDGEASGRE